MEHGLNYIPPPPEIIEGEKEYEIEQIIRHNRKNKPRKYLVRWKGYTATDDTWLEEEDFENAKEILKEYKKRRKLDGFTPIQ